MLQIGNTMLQIGNTMLQIGNTMLQIGNTMLENGIRGVGGKVRVQCARLVTVLLTLINIIICDKEEIK